MNNFHRKTPAKLQKKSHNCKYFATKVKYFKKYLHISFFFCTFVAKMHFYID